MHLRGGMLRRGGPSEAEVDLEGGGGGIASQAPTAPGSFAVPPSAAASSSFVGQKVAPLSTLAQPIAGVLAGGLLLGWLAGESGYLIIVLAICACGLIFAKYLSECVLLRVDAPGVCGSWARAPARISPFRCPTLPVFPTQLGAVQG